MGGRQEWPHPWRWNNLDQLEHFADSVKATLAAAAAALRLPRGLEAGALVVGGAGCLEVGLRAIGIVHAVLLFCVRLYVFTTAALPELAHRGVKNFFAQGRQTPLASLCLSFGLPPFAALPNGRDGAFRAVAIFGQLARTTACC